MPKIFKNRKFFEKKVENLLKNGGFPLRKELLKQRLVLKARTNIAEKINKGDIDVSKWYAERKRKDEFSTKTEQTTIINGIETALVVWK